MKRALLALVLLATPLAACKSPSLVPASSQMLVLQADTSLDVLYNTAAKIYLGQVATMDSATKAKVKPLLQKARKLVVACDQGQVLGEATSMADQIGQATALIGSVKALLGA